MHHPARRRALLPRQLDARFLLEIARRLRARYVHDYPPQSAAEPEWRRIVVRHRVPLVAPDLEADAESEHERHGARDIAAAACLAVYVERDPAARPERLRPRLLEPHAERALARRHRSVRRKGPDRLPEEVVRVAQPPLAHVQRIS